MSHARTSPAGPWGGFSCVRPPVMIRFRYTVGGELSPLLPGSPCRMSGVFRSTLPWSPNATLGSPVFAVSENNRPPPVPHTTCGGVCASPGQYSTPRVEALPDGTRKFQTSLPVVESSATTRPYGVVMYIRPSITSGVVSLDANPDPPRPPPRPCPAAPDAGVDSAAGAGRMW